MFIEIDQNITDCLTGNDKYFRQQIVQFLHEVAISMRRGKHCFFIPGLRDPQVKSFMSSNYPDIYTTIRQAADSEAKSLQARMVWKMVVTKTIPQQKVDNIIYYNPIAESKIEIYEETHLICENLYDCEFFKHIAQVYCRENNISKYSIKYFSRNGGGATTPKVIEKEAASKNHLCLLIADSDKKHTTDSEGATADTIRKQLKETPSDQIHLYVMESTREIENLIPHHILKKYSSEEMQNEFLNKQKSSFFDFKLGLTLLDIYDDEVFNHWHPILASLNIDCSERAKFMVASGNDYDRYKRLCASASDPLLVKGWGKKILSNVLSKDIGLLRSVKYNRLTPDQEKEWNAIGELIYNWTIAKQYN